MDAADRLEKSAEVTPVAVRVRPQPASNVMEIYGATSYVVWYAR